MILILLLIKLAFGFWGQETIFPFYTFNKHIDIPSYRNETVLKNEINFYKFMHDTAIPHVAISSVATVTILSFYTSFTLFPLSYFAYHIYVMKKSSHMIKSFDFVMNYKDDRYIFEKKGIIENYTIKLLKIYMFISIIFYMYFQKCDFKSINFYIPFILYIYLYSFLQTVEELNNVTHAKRESILKRIRWGCNINRISFENKVRLELSSYFNLRTDEDGYILGNEECDNLTEELVNIKYKLIDVFYKMLTRSIMTIFGEIINNINFWDKILIIIATAIFIKIKFFS